MREVLFVAAEASADLHAAGVARLLKARRPDLALAAIGGARLAAEGVEILVPNETLAVMGFVEVLRHIPRHLALLDELESRMRSGRVALLVLLDYPGFNMKLAARAKAAGVPVLYYVTPQVWAWGAKRLPKLARLVTKAACILPFEEELLRAHGVDATFVGHPLLDRARELPSKAEARAQLGLPADGEVLALFPGSRGQEIARHLDDFVSTARELERRRPGLKVVVSVAPTVKLDPARCPYPMVHAASFSVLRAADAALCKSGTTTLEAAVAGCPLIVAYRTNALTYRIARRVVRIPHIGLVNVVAGKEVAPEFVQHAAEPRRMADALQELIDPASERRARMVRELAEVRDRLGRPGAAERVAEMALALVGSGDAPARRVARG